ncbi:MAG: DUF167 domain-containing protein [Burkholderiales bacterium]|nr:DUF167 domain-containing protein [Burkholderiales bacterium]
MATTRQPPHAPKDSESNLIAALEWPCLRQVNAGKATEHLTLDVSVSPNAKKTEAVGWHDGALRIRLQAPPVDGAANEALRRWIADQIGTPMANVLLERGQSSRRKQLALHAPTHSITAWLARLKESGTFED